MCRRTGRGPRLAAPAGVPTWQLQLWAGGAEGGAKNKAVAELGSRRGEPCLLAWTFEDFDLCRHAGAAARAQAEAGAVERKRPGHCQVGEEWCH